MKNKREKHEKNNFYDNYNFSYPIFLSSTIIFIFIFGFLFVVTIITTESWPTQSPRRKGPTRPEGPTPPRRANFNPDKEGPTPNPKTKGQPQIRKGRANTGPRKGRANPNPREGSANPNPREGRANPTGSANPKPEKEGRTLTPRRANPCGQPLPREADGKPQPEKEGPTPARRVNPCLLFSSTIIIYK